MFALVLLEVSKYEWYILKLPLTKQDFLGCNCPKLATDSTKIKGLMNVVKNCVGHVFNAKMVQSNFVE